MQKCGPKNHGLASLYFALKLSRACMSSSCRAVVLVRRIYSPANLTLSRLVILFSKIHLLRLFFRLFTQVHLLIDGSVEGQYITIVITKVKDSNHVISEFKLWWWWSSSCRAANMDIPDPLSPLLPIVHRLRQVFRATSRILT